MKPIETGMTSLSFTGGFVLAGGRSSRMGTDKALTLLAGLPLIHIAIQTVAAAGVSAKIAGARSPLAAFAPEIPDTLPDSGPLGGIHAALSASPAGWNLFLPVDLPLMPASLLTCLLRRAALTGQPVTATRLNGRLEPFPAVLHRSILPQIVQRLETGKTACHQAWLTIPPELGTELDAVPVENLAQCGQCHHPGNLPPVFWFQSANTPRELEMLNRIYANSFPPSSIPSSNLRA